MKHPSRLLVVSTVILLSLIWGTTWAAIRVGLEGIPPFTGVALRFAIAAAVLILLGRLQGVRYGTSPHEKALWVVNGILSFCVSYGVVYWCEQHVPSGLASVLFATFPLFVAILAHFVLPDEPLRLQPLLGAILGFGGVGVIFSEDFAKLGGAHVAVASAVMLVSPLVSAVASVAIKRWGRGIHHISITSMSMAVGAALMGGLAAIAERGRPLVWTRASVGALLYLAIAGSAVTFSLYYWLLSHVPATKVALIAYLSPVVAVTVGALFLHEPYTLRTLVGSALVVVGVAFGASRFPRRRARAAGAALVLGACTGLTSLALSAEDGPLLFPRDPAPPAVRALGALDGPSAFTLSDDGSRAAAAFLRADEREKKRRSVIRVSLPAGEGAREIPVDGAVRGLFLRPEENAIYVITATEPTRADSGSSTLARIDLEKGKATRDVRLPLSAAGMDLSVEGDGLLVACRNELRVVLVPDLRSARLFRIPGENLSVAVLPGGTRALVGRTDGILLVDLSDPQGRDGLPVRGRLELPGPVTALVAAPDGSGALARLTDARTFQVSLESGAAHEVGVSAAIAWPGARAAYAAAPPEQREPAPPAPASPPPVSAPVSTTVAPPASPPEPALEQPSAQSEAAPGAAEVREEAPPAPTPQEPAPPPESRSAEPVSAPEAVAQGTPAVPAPTPEVAAEEKPLPAPSPAPPPQQQQLPSSAEGPTSPAPSPAPPSAPPPASPLAATEARSSGAMLRGRLTGPAAAEVKAVVVLGPNNLLREAARVAPSSDGSWSAGPLPRGTYRILVDAGGSRVASSDPAFLTVTVDQELTVDALELRVVAIRAP